MTASRAIHKAGRLLLLHRLQEAGRLQELTLQAIGDALGVDRSTVLRDLRDLEAARAEYRHLMELQPWLRPELTVSQFAARIGARPETVRRMIADGLVKARKAQSGKGGGKYGRWLIPVEELDRWSDRAGG